VGRLVGEVPEVQSRQDGLTVNRWLEPRPIWMRRFLAGKHRLGGSAVTLKQVICSSKKSLKLGRHLIPGLKKDEPIIPLFP
jgi:hypothetical protein